MFPRQPEIRAAIVGEYRCSHVFESRTVFQNWSSCNIFFPRNAKNKTIPYTAFLFPCLVFLSDLQNEEKTQ